MNTNPIHIVPAQPGQRAVICDSEGTVQHHPVVAWQVEVIGEGGACGSPVVAGYWPSEYWRIGFVLDNGSIYHEDTGEVSLEVFKKHCRKTLLA